MRRLVIAAALAVLTAMPAAADVRIVASSGGEVTEYLRLFDMVRQSGQRVVIDGPCFSACTLVLTTVPANRICVTRKAVLGFHAARLVDDMGNEYAAPNATRIVMGTYPPGVQNWIRRHGGLTSRPIFMRGKELAAIFPRCR